jgi:hypothetical protein
MKNKAKLAGIIAITAFIGFTLISCKDMLDDETVATPKASPKAGTYTSAQTVTLSCATDGAKIYYTLNGSDPTANSTPYSNPITISTTTTLKAVAVKSEMKDSGILEAVYTINTNNAIPVTFSGVNANGSASQTTTQLTLTFSAAIAGLSASDITLNGVAGVTKDSLSGSGPVYTLSISGFTSSGSLSVAVAKVGYTISGSPKPVTIYYYSGGGNPPVEEEEVASFAANATNPHIQLTSPTAYSIVNRPAENRAAVMKAVNPSGYAAALYSLSAYKNTQITLTFSADVKRVGAAGTLNWQINNDPGYPSVSQISNAAAGTWHTMGGTWTGTPTDANPTLYLSTNQNNSSTTTYYIDNFVIQITTAGVNPPEPPLVTAPPIGVGGVLNPATQTTQLSNSSFTPIIKPHGGGNKSLSGSPYGYETWDEDTSGDASFIWYGANQGGGAAFRAEWGNPNRPKDFLARVGYFWNTGNPHTYYGNIYCGFNYTKSGQYKGSFSYIGIYGWSKNPTVEYYIVENSYGNAWNDHAGYIARLNQDTIQGTEMTSYTLDGSVYKVYKKARTGPSIEGNNTSFTQFFSVRQTARTSGTISVTEHFKEWAKQGMNLGSNMYECKFKVEVGGTPSQNGGSTTGWFDASFIQFYRANNNGTIIQITQ